MAQLLQKGQLQAGAATGDRRAPQAEPRASMQPAQAPGSPQRPVRKSSQHNPSEYRERKNQRNTTRLQSLQDFLRNHILFT